MTRLLAVAGLLMALAVTPVRAADSDVVAVIEDRAEAHGVSPAYLIAVADCESRLDPYAIGQRGELGLFQLLPGGELDRFYARGYDDAFDVFQSADFAAARFSEGGASAWSCS